jgi:phosphoglycolate phosphatase
VLCLQHALHELGHAPPPATQLLGCIGPPLHESFRDILDTGDDDPRIDLAIGLYRERFGSTGYLENRVYPGIPRALESLQRSGYQLLVATSKPTVYAERIVSHFGLDAFFGGIYGSELSGARTNKGDLIEYVLDCETVDAECACMIGDRRHDIDGAKSRGVTAVGVAWGYGSLVELRAANPHHIVETVDDLATWFAA